MDFYWGLGVGMPIGISMGLVLALILQIRGEVADKVNEMLADDEEESSKTKTCSRCGYKAYWASTRCPLCGEPYFKVIKEDDDGSRTDDK